MRLCEVEGCGRKHHGRGLCRLHYQRLPEFRAKAREIKRRPEVRERRRAQDRERNQRPERKAYQREYAQRPETITYRIRNGALNNLSYRLRKAKERENIGWD